MIFLAHTRLPPVFNRVTWPSKFRHHCIHVTGLYHIIFMSNSKYAKFESVGPLQQGFNLEWPYSDLPLM